ncbi:peptidylprolyl isomerase [Waddlia chondrophila]|uniref:Peptidyl-prolyl cis-trans isomerase n=1 Tax=Waddlia chondrophila (strain ATCC VR-1470 / WSU 86-1044) TaxID=716544 RepID=D6YWB6_WADCW|nr:peptidylprolyl isomerase [Waddlia chondrophila]ADI38427.1 peptidyl-prolyl cis-trans isomerase B [Waddlia chondrophila WSU 86-1044]
MQRISYLLAIAIVTASAFILFSNKELHSMDISSDTETKTVKLQTSLGDITLELYPDKAPVTVKNFLQYVDSGHYDGTIFHRVIDGFMIQGGGYTENLTQKPTKEPIANEANNGLKNKRGTIAMARTNVVDSATSQFFINVVDNSFLDFKGENPREFGYCVFGKVTDGMDVVDQIKSVDTQSQGPYQDLPVKPVKIVKAKTVSAI